ncbi:MAG: DUF3127 domain-containing protein [Bacteroidales bacterium]|nr:DUF3127 domain-containing protein [Bacteroidales bacterium]
MEIIGKLIEKRETRQPSATFTVREFVVEVENQRDPRYNDFLLFQLTGDRCALLDQYQLQETIQITFDLRGRKWTAPDGTVRYITSLNAWRVDRPQVGGQPMGSQAYQPQQPYQQQVSQPAAPAAQPDFQNTGNPDEDLPF